jgi:cytochrome c-type biogenesis protein CcmH/NrfG
LLRQSVALDPSAFFVYIELGNVSLKRGGREEALRAYSEALRLAPPDPELRQQIQEQIRRVASKPLDRVRELRDPFLE